MPYRFNKKEKNPNQKTGRIERIWAILRVKYPYIVFYSMAVVVYLAVWLAVPALFAVLGIAVYISAMIVVAGDVSKHGISNFDANMLLFLLFFTLASSALTYYLGPFGLTNYIFGWN